MLVQGSTLVPHTAQSIAVEYLNLVAARQEKSAIGPFLPSVRWLVRQTEFKVDLHVAKALTRIDGATDTIVILFRQYFKVAVFDKPGGISPILSLHSLSAIHEHVVNLSDVFPKQFCVRCD